MASQPAGGPDLRALLKEAYLSVEKLKARVDLLEREKSEPIAVVGVGCRFPGGVDSPDAYWELLRNGVDAIQEVPKDRWDIDAYYDPNPDAPEKMYTRWGGFIDRVDAFDPQFFGISRREAAAMDPQQRLVLEVAWEALEHAGIRPDSLAGSATGVFLGISTSDYADMLASLTGPATDLYAGTGNSFSIASGRLSYVLGLQGPCMSVDTACSASLLAVHLAVESLRRKECTVALVGGVNVMLAPTLTAVMCRGRMLSFDGRCKTFDAAADGYVRGEGCGVVVLRRLSDAQAAGQRVLAVVKGSAVNQDGRSSGLTAPNGLAQEALLRAALKSAGISAAQVGYIEAHGTGTSLGDPIEMRALGAVMGEGRSPDRPLLVGAVKTNIGHLEAAAGVASFIKAVLSLHHGEIPPHLHFKKPSPHIAWGEMPVRVPTTLQPWPEANGRRIAGVSSFGFSGTNAHVILEAAPAVPFVRSSPDRPLHVLPISARSEAALAGAVSRLAGTCDRTALDLADVAFTAATGRSHFRHRVAAIGRATADVAAQLRAAASGGAASGIVRGVVPEQGAPKVAFLFTGQGSQYIDMGRQLYETAPAFRKTLDHCDQLLRAHVGESLVALVYGDGDAAAREARLADTKLTQPALFALEYALADLWLSWGVKPLAVMGHSLGEYVAACVAGVLSLEDAIALVAARARLMSALPAGGEMAAVFASEAAVSETIAPFAKTVSLAAVNGPDSVVISGAGVDVRAAVARLAERGVKAKPLSVSHAFHSPLMAPMLDGFETVARGVTFKAPRIRVISNVTGRAAEADEITRPEYWLQHIQNPVRFAPSIAWLHAQGFRVFLEVGPQATLSGMAARSVSDPASAWLPSLRKAGQDWEQMLRSLAELYVRGVDVDWPAFDRDYARQRVTLPTYPFERQRCWMDVSAARRPAPAGAPAEQRSQPADWLYEVDWQPAAPAAPARTASGRWLIVADRGGLGTSLAASLEAAGASCHVVPSHAMRDVRAAIEQARRAGPLAAIVHLASLDVETATLDAPALDGATEAACGSLLGIVQSIAAAHTDTPPRLTVVTKGAMRVGAQQPGSEPPTEAAQAPVWGLARVVALEHAELRVTAIDLDPERTNIDVLATELLAQGDENQVAFRGGVRHVARLVRHRREAPPAPQAGPLATIHGDATYLITGGAGALGLEVARSLAEGGARHLVVTGRSAPSSQAAAAFDSLRAAGTTVTVQRCDVGNEGDLRRVFSEIAASGFPLRGIVHAAGVLDDGVLAEQTWARFQKVMAPKVRGSWLLHRLTEHERLDFFVLFSSSSSVLGSPGQGNYAAANAFMDALAHHRRAKGQPAVSVSWGAWSDAGMAARLTGRNQGRLADRGLDLIPPAEGMRILRVLLQAAPAHVVVAPIRWNALLPSLAGRVPPILRSMVQETAGSTAAEPPRDMPGYMRRTLAEAPEPERDAILASFVRAQVARVLAADDPATISMTAPFDTLGFDSLMIVELRNALTIALECDVPPSTLYDRATVEALATALAARLREGGAATPVVSTVPSGADPQAAAALLSSLDQMPEDKIDALLSAMLAEQGTRHE